VIDSGKRYFVGNLLVIGDSKGRYPGEDRSKRYSVGLLLHIAVIRGGAAVIWTERKVNVWDC